MFNIGQNIEDLLAQLEVLNEEESYWIVGPETGRMLHWLIRVVAPENVLEIGTSIAYSGIWMASALEANSKGKLWTVESNDKRFKLAEKHIEESGLGHRINQLKGHAPEIFADISAGGYDFSSSNKNEFPEKIDLAFFDATKNEHKSFFDAVLPMMKSDGLIVADNVQSHRSAMNDFIESAYENKNLKIVEIPVGTGLLIARVL